MDSSTLKMAEQMDEEPTLTLNPYDGDGKPGHREQAEIPRRLQNLPTNLVAGSMNPRRPPRYALIMAIVVCLQSKYLPFQFTDFVL